MRRALSYLGLKEYGSSLQALSEALEADEKAVQDGTVLTAVLSGTADNMTEDEDEMKIRLRCLLYRAECYLLVDAVSETERRSPAPVSLWADTFPARFQPGRPEQGHRTRSKHSLPRTRETHSGAQPGCGHRTHGESHKYTSFARESHLV